MAGVGRRFEGQWRGGGLDGDKRIGLFKNIERHFEAQRKTTKEMCIRDREYADEYYNESPRANPREAAAYEKAQHAARDKVNSRASRSAMSQSGEWKI